MGVGGIAKEAERVHGGEGVGLKRTAIEKESGIRVDASTRSGKNIDGSSGSAGDGEREGILSTVAGKSV